MRIFFALTPVLIVTTLMIGAGQTALAQNFSSIDLGPVQKGPSKFTFRIVDRRDKPVSNAVVSALKSSSRRIALATSDASGKVTVEWPFSLAFNIMVDHPSFAAFHLSEQFARVPDTIVLEDPGVAQLMAKFPGDDGVSCNLFPLIAGSQGPKWSEQDGLLTIKRLNLSSQGPAYPTRIMHIPDEGPVFYSDVIDLRDLANNQAPPTIPLKAGLQFKGRLADDVPRPIRAGKVHAQVRSKSPRGSWLSLFSVASITSNGDFELESLPPGEYVELLAICDGWVSRNPSPKELDEFYSSDFGIKQAKHPPRNGSVITRAYKLLQPSPGAVEIPMVKTATLEVTVVAPDGSPIEGVRVRSMPLQESPGIGDMFLGSRDDSLSEFRERLASGQPEIILPIHELPSGSTAVSGADGVAMMENVPPGDVDSETPASIRLSIEHLDYHPTAVRPEFRGITGKVTVTIRPLKHQ